MSFGTGSEGAATSFQGEHSYQQTITTVDSGETPKIIITTGPCYKSEKSETIFLIPIEMLTVFFTAMEKARNASMNHWCFGKTMDQRAINYSLEMLGNGTVKVAAKLNPLGVHPWCIEDSTRFEFGPYLLRLLDKHLVIHSN